MLKRFRVTETVDSCDNRQLWRSSRAHYDIVLFSPNTPL